MKPAYRARDEWQWIALYSTLFLFFFQLLADFVESIYSFGLLGTSIPNEIVSVLLFFSPALLLAFGKRLTGVGVLFFGELALLSRAVTPLLDPRGKLLVSGIGVGCFLLFIPILLWRLSLQKSVKSARHLGLGMLGGISLSALFRVWGSGSDLTTHGQFQFIGWALAILAGILLWQTFPPVKAAARKKQADRSPGFMRLAGLCLGIMGVIVLFYYVFTSPNVIARWVEGNYLAIVISLGAGMVLFSFTFAVKPDRLKTLKAGVLLIWNIVFVIALTFTILPYQIRFPATPEGYPLYEPPKPLWADFALYPMLLLSPVLILDFILYTREIIRDQARPRQLGGGFFVAGFFLLVMVLAHVFTTVYDYIPFIGPYFRDKFWLVHLFAGVVAALPTLLVMPTPDAEKIKGKPVLAMILAAIYLATVLGVFITAAKPQMPVEARNSLRVMTYNIQQGYNEAGRKNFEGQLNLIRSQNPDILGLQESDTNRIAGGNSDVVRYFADRLNMYSYYGPKTITGTFGIALLSRYPIENPRTFYMYSQGEQTAAIVANIRAGDKLFNIFVTHLGNGGPIVQQEALLKEVDALEDVIAMGDFNFRPDSEQYRLTTSILDDAWLLKWSSGVDDQGYNPTDRIDHVFVSPGTNVTEARYLTQPESDHPALVVEIAW